jgi:hypothetical protein
MKDEMGGEVKPMEEIIKVYCHLIDFGVKTSRQEADSDREDIIKINHREILLDPTILNTGLWVPPCSFCSGGLVFNGGKTENEFRNLYLICLNLFLVAYNNFNCYKYMYILFSSVFFFNPWGCLVWTTLSDSEYRIY